MPSTAAGNATGKLTHPLPIPAGHVPITYIKPLGILKYVPLFGHIPSCHTLCATPPILHPPTFQNVSVSIPKLAANDPGMWKAMNAELPTPADLTSNACDPALLAINPVLLLIDILPLARSIPEIVV